MKTSTKYFIFICIYYFIMVTMHILVRVNVPDSDFEISPLFYIPLVVGMLGYFINDYKDK